MAGKLTLTPENWKQIIDTNLLYNKSIKYKTDLELYNRPDFWTIAEGYGDCDDYAVTKKHALIKQGIPKECLRLATCWVEGPKGPGTGVYHAVLIVETDRGSYVLDNRTKTINYYKDIPYKWHRIQVPGNMLWKEIENA